MTHHGGGCRKRSDAKNAARVLGFGAFGADPPRLGESLCVQFLEVGVFGVFLGLQLSLATPRNGASDLYTFLDIFL